MHPERKPRRALARSSKPPRSGPDARGLEGVAAGRGERGESARSYAGSAARGSRGGVHDGARRAVQGLSARAVLPAGSSVRAAPYTLPLAGLTHEATRARALQQVCHALDFAWKRAPIPGQERGLSSTRLATGAGSTACAITAWRRSDCTALISPTLQREETTWLLRTRSWARRCGAPRARTR